MTAGKNKYKAQAVAKETAILDCTYSVLVTRMTSVVCTVWVTILVMVTAPQIGLYSCLRVRGHFHFTLAKVTPLSAFSFTFLP